MKRTAVLLGFLFIAGIAWTEAIITPSAVLSLNARDYTGIDNVWVDIDHFGVGTSISGNRDVSPFAIIQVSFVPISTLIERYVGWEYRAIVDSNLYIGLSFRYSFLRELLLVRAGGGAHLSLLIAEGAEPIDHYFPGDSMDDNGIAEFDGMEAAVGPGGFFDVSFRIRKSPWIAITAGMSGAYDMRGVGTKHPTGEGSKVKLNLEYGAIFSYIAGIAFRL